MPGFLFSKAFWIGLLVVAIAGAGLYWHHTIYAAGEAHVENAQLKAQKSTNEKDKLIHEKILHDAPLDAGRVPLGQWLYEHTSGPSQ